MALTLKQIKKAINDKLIAKFPDIEVTSRDVSEGFNRPSFFTQLDVKRDAGLFTASRSMTVRIYYFPKDRYEYSVELLEMQESLEQLFDLTLPIEDRVITITETNSDVVDGILQFEIDFTYQEAKVTEETNPSNELMMELNYRKVDA